MLIIIHVYVNTLYYLSITLLNSSRECLELEIFT